MENLTSRLQTFFKRKDVIEALKEPMGERQLEEKLLRLGFESQGVVKTNGAIPALFGRNCVKSDYDCKGDNAYIELKSIKAGREYSIKDGLIQVLEQTYCGHRLLAILLLVDWGKAAHRQWSEEEKRFISFFIKGFAPTTRLEAIRVRIFNQKVETEVVDR